MICVDFALDTQGEIPHTPARKRDFLSPLTLKRKEEKMPTGFLLRNLSKKLLIVCLTSSLLFINFTGLAEAGPKKWLKLSAIGMHPKTEARMRLFAELIDIINKDAKGEIHIELKGGPEVIPIRQQGEAAAKGVVFMSQLATAAFESLVPSAPMALISDVDHQQEKKKAYPIWREAYAKAGLFFLGRTDAKNERSFYLGFNKEIKSVSDLKGLTFTGSTLWGKAMAEALGMKYSIIKKGEAYTAMDTGVFNGFGTTASVWTAWSMTEVVKYFIDHPIFYTNMVMIINLKTFNEFPERLQKVVLNAYDKMETKLVHQIKASIDKSYQKMHQTMTPIKFSESDAEKFVSTAYRAQLNRMLKGAPVYGPKLVKPLGLDKFAE